MRDSFATHMEELRAHLKEADAGNTILQCPMLSRRQDHHSGCVLAD